MEKVNAVTEATPGQIYSLALGIIMVLASAAVIAALLVWLFKPVSIFGIKFKKDEAEEDERPTLMHHRLFKLFTTKLAPGGIQFVGSDKAIMMENFLRLKFQTIYEYMKDFAEKLEAQDYEGLSKLPDVVRQAVEAYEAECKNLVHITSRGKIRGMPICMCRKFRQWHRRHETQFFDDCADLSADRSITTKKERAWLMFDALHYALRETGNDAELTLPSLNGDFDDELARMVLEQTSCGGTA